QPREFTRVRDRQLARILGGADDRARAGGARSPPRRRAPAGLRGGVLRGARPSRAVAAVGALRAVSVVAGPGLAAARVWPLRADPRALVPARAVGLRPPVPRRHPRAASALEQRRVCELSVLH